MKIFLTLLIFFLFSYSSWSQNVKGDVEIKILDTSVKEGQMLTVVIVNHSDFTYWFPLDISEFSLNAALSGSYESTVHTLQQSVQSGITEVPIIIEANANAEELLVKWKEQLISKGVDDFVVLKANEVYTVQIPFRMNFTLLPAKFDLSFFSEVKQLSYTLHYTLLPRVLEKVVSVSRLKEIEEKGYYLYTHDLLSNEVPVLNED